MRSPACCRLENAIFPPHIHRTWPKPFSPALYIGLSPRWLRSSDIIRNGLVPGPPARPLASVLDHNDSERRRRKALVPTTLLERRPLFTRGSLDATDAQLKSSRNLSPLCPWRTVSFNSFSAKLLYAGHAGGRVSGQGTAGAGAGRLGPLAGSARRCAAGSRLLKSKGQIQILA